MTIRYTNDHEWIAASEGGVATVGITTQAQAALGDVVFVELPEVGKTYKPGDIAGVIESVKAAADVYMPISGEVTEVNEALRESPTLLNTDPMTTGWVFKMKLSNNSELDSLMNEEAYLAFAG